MNRVGVPRGLLVLVSFAAFVIALSGVHSIRGILGPVMLALVLTITVNPLRRPLVARGAPDWVASIVVTLTVYVVLALLSFALVVSVGQMAQLVPDYRDEMQDLADASVGQLENFGVSSAQVSDMVQSFDVGPVLSYATGIFSATVGVLTDLFFVVTLVLFLAFDTTGTERVLAHLRGHRESLVASLNSFVIGTRSYIGVSAVFGLIVAVIDWGALVLLGVPGAFIWAVLSFVTNFIPNIGFVIGLVPPATIALLEGGWPLALAVIAVYSVVNVVIQTVIQPRVVGDRVGLSASLTFLSLVFWSWTIGPLGALLAVPLTLLVRALLIEADPDARWALPLISGKDPGEPEPEIEPDVGDPAEPDESEASGEPAGAGPPSDA